MSNIASRLLQAAKRDEKGEILLATTAYFPTDKSPQPSTDDGEVRLTLPNDAINGAHGEIANIIKKKVFHEHDVEAIAILGQSEFKEASFVFHGTTNASKATGVLLITAAYPAWQEEISGARRFWIDKIRCGGIFFPFDFMRKEGWITTADSQ